MNHHFTRLKALAGGTLVSAIALLAAPAHAGLATIESAPAMVYFHGEQFVDAGLTFTSNVSALAQSLGLTDGMGGMILDGNNPNSCGAVLDCPSGNNSKYYTGWNDGSVDVERAGGFFSLSSLRFAFFAPSGGVSNGIYGELVLHATLTDGTLVSRSAEFAPQDDDGHFMFATWNLDPDFSSLSLRNLSISACMYDDAGDCLNPNMDAFNQAQFAIDDLAVSVPLPATPPLLLLGLAGLVLSRRRATPNAQ